MQIHELNNFDGILGAGAFLVIDDGSDTGRISSQDLLKATEKEISDLGTALNGRIDNIIAGGSAPSEAEIIDARQGVNGINYPSLGDAIRTQISEEQNALALFESTAFDITQHNPINLLDRDAMTFGYYLTNAGVVGENASYWYSDYIPVEPGKTYSRQYGNQTVVLGRALVGTHWISCYDINKNILADKGSSSYPTSFTVPAGVAYIRISDSTNMNVSQYPTFVEGTTVLDYSDYFDPYTTYKLKTSALNDASINSIVGARRTSGLVKTFDISSDNHIFTEKINDVNNYTIEFKGIITSFNELIIQHGYQVSGGGYVRVTPTDFEYYIGTEVSPRVSEAHGLTIKDYINIKIDTALDNRYADFTITTNGGTYTKHSAWDVRLGDLGVRSVGANSLTDCVFSYYARGWRKPIHIYGDSYVGVYDDRWTYYLFTNGYENYNLNAYSGRISTDALASLKDVLDYATPDKIIWALGMNDGDTGGAINASWKSCVDELMSICEAKGIELILATCPNVPTVDNTYKNAYVIASGYRYIDFASAVGAANDTTWFDNMLSGDNTHPDVQGAIALYNQAIADVPELMD